MLTWKIKLKPHDQNSIGLMAKVVKSKKGRRQFMVDLKKKQCSCREHGNSLAFCFNFSLYGYEMTFLGWNFNGRDNIDPFL